MWLFRRKKEREGGREREGELTNCGVGHDHHDIRVGGKNVNEGGKVRVLDLHALERRLELAANVKKRREGD